MSEEKNFAGMLIDRGFIGLHIYSEGGLPIFSKMFDYDRKNTTEDSLLIGAFLSAIIRMTHIKMTGVLSDIGFMNYRFYFEHSMGLFFVLMVDESKFKYVQLQNLHIILKGTIIAVRDLFLRIITDIDENILQNPSRLSVLHISLSKHVKKVENLILKSFEETLTIIEGEPIFQDIFHASKIEKNPKTILEKKERDQTSKALEKYIIESIKDITSRLIIK